MSWTRTEARWRDALLGAVLPVRGEGLPSFEDVARAGFWSRFDAAAPVHLRLGFRLSVLALGALLPWLLTPFRTLPGLDAEGREAVVVRAARLPGLGALVEVAKLVACLAWFREPRVQARVRGRP